MAADTLAMAKAAAACLLGLRVRSGQYLMQCANPEDCVFRAACAMCVWMALLGAAGPKGQHGQHCAAEQAG